MFRRQHVSGARVRAPKVSHDVVFRAPYTIRRAKTHKYIVTVVGPVEYSDAATVYLALVPSGTDVRESADAATALLRLTPSGSDIRESLDSATVRLALTPDTHDCVVTLRPEWESTLDRKWLTTGERKWGTTDLERRWEAVIGEAPVNC